MAQRLRARRHEQGALELETLEVRARFDGGAVSGLAVEPRDRAKELIEDFMIAANGVVARYLAGKRFPVLRRVVHEPERWQRIVDLADTHGCRPPRGARRAVAQRVPAASGARPTRERFPDLSLAIIKLLGSGEYEATQPGEPVDGHFGLAVTHYAHSTAPNRRYPDLLTQRLVKAALAGGSVPVPRRARWRSWPRTARTRRTRRRRSSGACASRPPPASSSSGSARSSTASSPARAPRAPGCARWTRRWRAASSRAPDELDVGDAVRVRLVDADPERGFIDFAVIS